MGAPVIRHAIPASLIFACAPAERPEALYDPSSAELFDAPWPTDDRLTATGLDLSGFPGGPEVALLGRYLGAASALPAWGTSAPIYIPLSGLPDPELLPHPLTSNTADSSLWLIDIDPASADRGARVPVQWELLRRGTLVPTPTLAVAPIFGFPLAPDRRYALVVTTDIVAPNAAFAERLASDPGLADLRGALDALGLPAKRVAVATAFTTRDPLDELDRMVAAARALPSPTLRLQAEPIGTFDAFTTYEVGLDAPLWMHGNKPFAVNGGGFRFDDAGRPIVADWEPLRLAVSVPTAAPMPASGYPIVIYGHGTGGSYSGFADGNGAFEPGAVLAGQGFVGIGFDQPLHGARGTPSTDTDLHSFNYLNPESARAGFRQGALDIVWILRALSAGPVALTLPDGGVVRLDPGRISYLGHSHGGLTGALALPWVGEQLDSAVLSGAGGGLAISIVKRKDPLDIAALVSQVLGLGPDEALTPLHPVIGLVQLLVEETDPINYAPAWLADDRGYAASTTAILLTSGRFDLQTDHETAEALAIAARVPQVSPAWNNPFGFGLRGLSPVAAPARDTVTAFDGAPRTAGLSQWAEGDHFVIFRDPRARDMYARFLRSALDGRAEIAP